ncbi:hypothetical protein FOZ61_002743 [Perkinsus olseni]|uniref:EF-hand domain-containing protein n=1 Tax=Perkinsus olseni TaxID=32597 RepID=A0A7J6M6C0_PEROL|nr:hypothetical protein FOZ61_002743 [Perkinsus olseni]KAF4667067.1 hypothetical protein FOL46_002733 [Perkinsus olseni]
MEQLRDSVVGGAGRMLDVDGDGVVTLQEVEESANKAYRRVSAVVDTTRDVVDRNRTVLGGVLGLFLLRYGNHFPYTSLLLQSIRVEDLKRDFDDIAEVYSEVRDDMRNSLPGNIPLFCYKRDGDAALPDIDDPDVGRPPTDVGVLEVVLRTMDTEKLSRAFRNIYTQVLTCLATALSRNAARFGLGMNTASTIVGVVNQFLSPQIKRFEESETGRSLSSNSRLAIRFTTKGAVAAMAVYIAYKMERSLANWANCLLGAQLLTNCGHELYYRYVVGTAPPAGSSRKLATSVTVIAALGFGYQIRSGPLSEDMPFWLRWPLIIPSAVENVLQAVAVGTEQYKLTTSSSP